MGASLTALLGYDVTDPRSPHSVHVASEADVPAVDPWGRGWLRRAVRLADDGGAVVVLDHGRDRLYLAPAGRLHYRPPGTLDLGRPPALVVDDPALLSPDGADLTVEPFDPAALDGPPPDWSDGPDDPTDETDTPSPADADTPATEADVTDDSQAAADPDDADDTVAVDRGGSDTTGGEAADPGDDPDPVADGSGTPAETADVTATSVTVSPTFDVLVPAYDIEERGQPAEPLERHAVESPTGTSTGTGTPSG